MLLLELVNPVVESTFELSLYRETVTSLGLVLHLLELSVHETAPLMFIVLNLKIRYTVAPEVPTVAEVSDT